MKLEVGKAIQAFSDSTWGDGLRRIRKETDRLVTQGIHSADSVRRLVSHRPGVLSDPGPSGDSAVDVILPAAAGSFGDEGLARGTAIGMRATGHTPQLWAPDKIDHVLPDGRGGTEKLRTMSSLRWGTTSLMPRIARQRWGKNPLIVIGADTIGGDYLHGYLGYRVRALHIAAARGAAAQLVNFSFSDAPTRTAVALLRSLPDQVQLWARDELSRKRAQEALGRRVESAPDVAALMAPRVDVDTESFLAQFQVPPVALVPNAHFVSMGWQSPETVLNAWLRIAEDICAQNQPLALVPHDIRKRPGDVALAHVISQKLSERGIEAPVFEPRSAPLAKRVLGQSAGVVSARMHGCVAAMSSGVPTVGIEYLGKFRGQFDWYGELGEVVSATEALAAGSRLVALMDGSTSANSSSTIDADSIGWLRTF